jgi:hypothetical protein
MTEAGGGGVANRLGDGDRKRNELALARLLVTAIDMIRNTGPSDLDIRIENAKDMIRELKLTYPEAMEI